MTDLVSVIVPAYNAEGTLDETLRSVRSQTHVKVEIIVVDDGSEDRTPNIVGSHAAMDDRVRLVRQRNSGVAEARNRGAREARADLLAFVDADDLWAPHKIERQLSTLRASGPRAGLVYTWYALIDITGRVINTCRPTLVGDAVEAICRNNFVGNGSSTLVTRAAFEQAGGFDPSLNARGATGCEDWLFYFKVAEHYDFAVVPELLTGYRQHPRCMSANHARMLRSFELAAERVLLQRPEFRDAISRGKTDYIAFLLLRAISQRRSFGATRMMLTLLRREPARAINVLAPFLTRKSKPQMPTTNHALSKMEPSTFVIGRLRS